MVSVGLTHKWRSLFTIGKGVPGDRGVPGTFNKQATVRPVAPGQSKLRVFFAKLTRTCWIRRKPVVLMSTPATTVLSLPSDGPHSPESLSKSASKSISLATPAISPAAVTEPKPDYKRIGELAAVLERVDRIVDGFHRVLGSQLTPKQYRACLQARAALHILLLRLDGGMGLDYSSSLQAKAISFAADQIISDGQQVNKVNAEKIVKQMFSVYPLLAPKTSPQSPDHDVFSCAADVLKDVLKEFAGLKQRGVYDSYVAFGLVLQTMAAPAEAPASSSIQQNPFQLALDWSTPHSGLSHNAVPESLGASARANFIRQVKAWGVELKLIGEALSTIYDVHAISVSSEDASPVIRTQRNLQSDIEKEIDREIEKAIAEDSAGMRYRDLTATTGIPTGINWLENAGAFTKARKTHLLPEDVSRPAASAMSNVASGQAFPVTKDPAKAYAMEIAASARPEGTPSVERSIARRPAAAIPRNAPAAPHLHPAVQIFKDEIYKLQSELMPRTSERPASPVSKFSHLGHTFNCSNARTDPKAEK
jgi:hypothetical protein